MNDLVAIVLPTQIDNRIRGSRLPVVIFMIYAGLSLVRSLIHLLAPDGGAGSIAGLDLAVAGAEGIVFAVGLWGSSQLLLALIQLLVVVRYRALVPLMYLLLIVEIGLRELVGWLKPVQFAHTPPGAIGNWIVLPLAALMLGLSLWSATRRGPRYVGPLA